MATAQVTINPNTYVSLGTSPMIVGPGRYQVVASASQPANNALGHSMAYAPSPFTIAPATAQSIWAQALDTSTTSVTVTT